MIWKWLFLTFMLINFLVRTLEIVITVLAAQAAQGAPKIESCTTRSLLMQDWVFWLSWESLEKKSFGFRFVTKTKLLSTFQSLHLENLWSSAASFLMSYHKYLHFDLWSNSLKLGKTRIHALVVKYLVSFIKCTRAISHSFQCYFQTKALYSKPSFRIRFLRLFWNYFYNSSRSTCFLRIDIIVDPWNIKNLNILSLASKKSYNLKSIHFWNGVFILWKQGPSADVSWG